MLWKQRVRVFTMPKRRVDGEVRWRRDHLCSFSANVFSRFRKGKQPMQVAVRIMRSEK